MKNTNRAIVPSFDHRPPSDETIEACLPLVRSIAARLRFAHDFTDPFDDLYGVGLDGLLRAAERFEPARGVAFTTFAYLRIRGAILDFERRGPHRRRKTPRDVALAEPEIAPDRQLGNASRGEPTTVAVEAGPMVPVAPAAWPPVPLSEVDELPDESSPHPDREIERKWLAERIGPVLAALPEIERRVIELHYYEDLSFSEIGDVLGICKPWAFRLHNRALALLRRALGQLGALDLEALSA